MGEKKFDKSKYDQEYMKKNRYRFTFMTTKDRHEYYKAEAAKREMSLTAFIIYCIEKELNSTS